MILCVHGQMATTRGNQTKESDHVPCPVHNPQVIYKYEAVGRSEVMYKYEVMGRSEVICKYELVGRS